MFREQMTLTTERSVLAKKIYNIRKELCFTQEEMSLCLEMALGVLSSLELRPIYKSDCISFSNYLKFKRAGYDLKKTIPSLCITNNRKMPSNTNSL